MESDPLYLLKKYTYYSWIISLGILVYANSLFNGFIWDDITYIVNNPQVHSLSWNLLFGRNWFNSAGFYRPIPALYFATLFSIFGTTQFFYHIVQVTLHILNAIFVFTLFKKFFSKQLSLLLALVFLVHPMNTESVGYIASADNVLFFTFGISALLLSFRLDLSKKIKLLIYFFLFLSMMTKETGVLFILAVLFVRFVFVKKERLFFALSSLATVLLYIGIRFAVIGITYTSQTTIPIMRLSMFQRLVHVPLIIFYYLKTFLFPIQQAVSQNWTIEKISLFNFYVPLFIELGLLVVLGAIGAIHVKKIKKDFFAFLFFALWSIVGIGMLAQIIPLDMTVADRWFYFPMIGFLGLMGMAVSHIKNVRGVWVVGGIIVVLFSFLTLVRNAQWVDAETLYRHDITISDDYNKEDGLAIELINQGKFEEAETHAKKSISLNPTFANLNDLGVIYQHEGKFGAAKMYYQKAVDAHPDTVSPVLNLAALLVLHDNPKPAIPLLKNILLKQYPAISRFWVLLAIGEYRMGNKDEAIFAAQKAVSLSNTVQAQYVLDFIQSKEPSEHLDIKRLE